MGNVICFQNNYSRIVQLHENSGGDIRGVFVLFFTPNSSLYKSETTSALGFWVHLTRTVCKKFKLD